MSQKMLVGDEAGKGKNQGPSRDPLKFSSSSNSIAQEIKGMYRITVMCNNN